MVPLKITYKDPNQLKPRTTNPRTHSAKQIRQIVASIKQHGFINPILTDGADGIIAGHARVEAAKLSGMTGVPTVRVDHLTPAQIRAYVIADNKLAENAGWNRELLALELQELSVEPNFDITVMLGGAGLFYCFAVQLASATSSIMPSCAVSFDSAQPLEKYKYNISTLIPSVDGLCRQSRHLRDQRRLCRNCSEPPHPTRPSSSQRGRPAP